MQRLSYYRPASMVGLWPALESAAGAACLLAGGTDLVPSLKNGTRSPGTVIDLKRLPELRGIEPLAGGGLGIGATVTLHEVARSPLVAGGWPTLAEAAGTIASYQIRNRGTVAGNLCLDTRCPYFNQSAYWRLEYPDCRKTGGGSCYVVPRGDRCHALSSSDLAPLLIALDAYVEVAAVGGSRPMLVEELFAMDGLRATTLGPGEVVTRVVLPPAGDARVVYRRFAPRETVDFPVLSVAAAVAGDRVRIVVGHVASRPLRASAGEGALATYLSSGSGTPAGIGEIVAGELELTSSARGSVTYKKQVLRAVVTEMVTEIRSGAVAERARGMAGPGAGGV